MTVKYGCGVLTYVKAVKYGCGGPDFDCSSFPKHI